MHATEDQFKTRHVLLPQISSEKENVIGILATRGRTVDQNVISNLSLEAKQPCKK